MPMDASTGLEQRNFEASTIQSSRLQPITRYHAAHPASMTPDIERDLESQASPKVRACLAEERSSRQPDGGQAGDENAWTQTDRIRYGHYVTLSRASGAVEPSRVDPSRANFVRSRFEESEQQAYDDLCFRFGMGYMKEDDILDESKDQIVRKASERLGGTQTLSLSDFETYEAKRLSEYGTGWAPATTGLTEEQEVLAIRSMDEYSTYWHEFRVQASATALRDRNLKRYRAEQGMQASAVIRAYAKARGSLLSSAR